MDSFNIALNCGSFMLPWNALMLALGILVAVVVSEIIIKKSSLYKDLAFDACIVGIPCGIVGARLFSALSGKIAFSALFDLSKAGMNLPGALLFAGIGILIYIAVKKLDRGAALDALMPGALFGLAVGRWSDFFLCDGLGPVVGAGVPKFFPLVTFTHAYFSDHQTVAYAVFFLDFLICAALGVVALCLRRKKLIPGQAARTAMILYVLCEFVLEWLRDGQARQIVFGEMRFNQLVLIGMLIVLVILALVAKKRPAAEQTAEAVEPDAAGTQETTEEPDEAPKQPEKETEESEA